MNEAEVRVKVENLLKRLGFKKNNIKREQSVHIPVGCKKPKPYFIDFLISIDARKLFLIETKSSKISVFNERAKGQAESYAKQIGVRKFVICNGKDFVLFNTNDSKILLSCKMKDFQKIKDHLSIENFVNQRRRPEEKIKAIVKKLGKNLGKELAQEIFHPNSNQKGRGLKNRLKNLSTDQKEDIKDATMTGLRILIKKGYSAVRKNRSTGQRKNTEDRIIRSTKPPIKKDYNSLEKNNEEPPS